MSIFRTLLSLAFFILGFTLIAQDNFPYLDYQLKYNSRNVISFDTIVKAPETTKAELYSSAREWFVNTFNNAESVLQMDDKESGKLIGKGFQKINLKSGRAQMWYTISIYLKDGRYKIEISDFIYKSPTGAQYPWTAAAEESITDEKVYKKNGKPRSTQAGYKSKTVEEAFKIIQSIINGMGEKPAVGNEGDW